MVTISLAKTCPPPNGEELTDRRGDDGWDIDRWENDGGKSCV